MRLGLAIAAIFYGLSSAATPARDIAFEFRFNGLSAPVTARQLIVECRGMLQQPTHSLNRQDCERLDRHINWLESRLKSLCVGAGERIVRTAVDVDTIYLKPPSRSPDDSFVIFHEDDRMWDHYVAPRRGRHYLRWEMASLQAPGKVNWHRYEKSADGKRRTEVSKPYGQADQPLAKFGVTWRSIGDKDERRFGLYGDETTVFDVAMANVLGVRKFYFYVLQPRTIDQTGKPLQSQFWGRNSFPEVVQPCRNIKIKADDSYIDHRPRDSYEFVARVLKPKILSDELAIGSFDLTRGSGSKQEECLISITFGPRVTPDDIEITRKDRYSMKIAIKGTNDAIICQDYFFPAIYGRTKDTEYRFYDGLRWSGSDLERRILPSIGTTRPRNPTSVTPRMAPAPNAATTPKEFSVDTGRPIQRVPSSSKSPRQNAIIIKCVGSDGKVSYSDRPCP